jgi:hypothetical protein
LSADRIKQDVDAKESFNTTFDLGGRDMQKNKIVNDSTITDVSSILMTSFTSKTRARRVSWKCDLHGIDKSSKSSKKITTNQRKDFLKELDQKRRIKSTPS